MQNFSNISCSNPHWLTDGSATTPGIHSLSSYATLASGPCPTHSNTPEKKSVLEAILDNHLLLSIIILVALLMVPALLLRGRGLRDSHGNDRRKGERKGIDRRA